MSATAIITFRNGTPSPSYVLKDAEPGWDSNNKIFKVGDGVTPWSALPTINVDPADIENAVGDYLDENPVSVGAEYVQSIPAGTWVISHSLGRKPSVSVYVGGKEVLTDIVSSNTQVTITFAAPQVGTATLI